MPARIDALVRGRRCVVTGAAGFIGAALSSRLATAGAHVIAVDRSPTLSGVPGLDSATAEVVVTDLLTAELVELLRDTDFVFHLAGRGGVSTSWGPGLSYYLADNVRTTGRVLEAAITGRGRSGTGPRIVYASSSSVYGSTQDEPLSEATSISPRSPYGITKAAAEHLITAYTQAYDLDALSCRLFTVYGPGQRGDMLISRLLRAWHDRVPVALHAGGAIARDLTFIDDAIDGLILAAAYGDAGETYNISGGVSHDMNTVVQELCRQLGGSIPLRAVGIPPGVPLRTLADLTRAREQLGYMPSFCLPAGLAKQIAAGVDEASESPSEALVSKQD
jgi:UDP-glucuronate 4-epimerase